MVPGAGDGAPWRSEAMVASDFHFTILVVPYMRRRGEQVALAGSDPARWTILMDQIRTQMQFAESVGYDGFAMTEQHLQVEGIETTTNPIFWDHFVAQHTTTMRVGQLGMNLTAVNPIQLAENLAMLDHFCGGRMFAGFSRGNTARWTGTFGQHLDITATHSDKSDADQRNRRALYENWRLVKSLWTQEKVSIRGEFWQAPPPMPWSFPPTTDWDPGAVDGDGMLREIGIVPRPLQQDPHPPVYAPFSYSMETSRFWAREGGKMVCFITPEKQDFIRIVLDVYLEEAQGAGRDVTPADALAIGGHLTMGRTPAERADLYRGFEELFNWAYDAPPYHVPMGRLWGGSREQELDHVASLHEELGVTEFFLWHHVGYFEQDQELGMLDEFAQAVIRPMRAGIRR